MSERWFRFHPSRFMAGIRGLNANEVKVYISLLCRMYESDGPITADREILSTYCEVRPSSFDKALDRLIRLEKIQITTDGRLINGAAAEEISYRASKSEIAKRAGKISSEKKQENQSASAAPAEHPFNHKEEEKERDKKEEEAKASLCILRFSEFWDAYPHREGKRNRAGAEKKYRAAVKSGVSEQTIIDGAIAAHNDARVRRGFARDPTTWLNQEGWSDQPEPPSLTVFPGGNDGRSSRRSDDELADLIARAARG